MVLDSLLCFYAASNKCLEGGILVMVFCPPPLFL